MHVETSRGREVSTEPLEAVQVSLLSPNITTPPPYLPSNHRLALMSP